MSPSWISGIFKSMSGYVGYFSLPVPEVMGARTDPSSYCNSISGGIEPDLPELKAMNPQSFSSTFCKYKTCRVQMISMGRSSSFEVQQSSKCVYNVPLCGRGWVG